MFPRYFSFKYFAPGYFGKGSQVNPLYSNSGDIISELIKLYSKSGDIQTTAGIGFEKKGDIWVTLLKRPPHVYVNFGYDIETELT